MPDVTRLLLADATPPFSKIGPGGKTIAPGAEVELVPASAYDAASNTWARAKIRVSHRGELDDKTSGGDVWIGWGQTAGGDPAAGAAGLIGDWIEPGGFVEELFGDAVRVRNTGSKAVRVTWMEWAA